MFLYVDAGAARGGNGTKEFPFKKIQEAADIAKPGDEVIVMPGIYREHVNPKNAGCAAAPIVYRSAEPRKAVITGAEILCKWTNMEGSVWTARVSNSVFGSYNPYTTLVSGDWFIAYFTAHTGDVYLNGKSMYEVTDIEKVRNPEIWEASWDQDFSLYTWYAKQDEEKDETVFYANFRDKNPNEECIEISVRENCFYPLEEGVGYITLSGFTVRQAATQWAPPTAYQEGMVGPHWSKGWIIEDCDISESKCCGISLGKYKQEYNDNKWSVKKYKDGTQNERDSICQAQIEGWTKEKIGHHIIRRCEIHDCGQTGIVGHLGGVFSVIEDNHIHHINNKRNLAGAEIGGIKMHAAIDVIFRRNHIHHCTRGLWLDWQAQGTRVTRNLFHDNTLPMFKGTGKATDGVSQGIGEDIFIEVSHGPTLVDNNLLLSIRSLKLPTQGVALVHNLIGGSFTAVGRGTDNGSRSAASPRYTPYHVPHRTEVVGFMTILHGDMRVYNNVFVQQQVNPALIFDEGAADEWDDWNVKAGTFKYNGYPTFEEWDKEFEGYCGMGSGPSDRYYSHLPVWMKGNAFFNGAIPSNTEENYYEDTTNKIELTLKEENGVYTLRTNLYRYLPEYGTSMVNTEVLGMAFEPEQYFENPDGTPILFNEDYYGNHREATPVAGPFEEKKEEYMLL